MRISISLPSTWSPGRPSQKHRYVERGIFEPKHADVAVIASIYHHGIALCRNYTFEINVFSS
jgi:hypothetical protein